MNDLPLMGLRKFRDTIGTIKEPVRVVKTRGAVEVLGVWIPADSSVLAMEQVLRDKK